MRFPPKKRAAPIYVSHKYLSLNHFRGPLKNLFCRKGPATQVAYAFDNAKWPCCFDHAELLWWRTVFADESKQTPNV